MTKKRTSGLKARAATKPSPMEQELRDLGLTPATQEFTPMVNEKGEPMAQLAPMATETPILDAIEQSLVGETSPADETITEAEAVADETIMVGAEDHLDDDGGMSDAEILASLEGKTDEEVALALGLASDELPVPDAAHAVGEEDTAALDETAPAMDLVSQVTADAVQDGQLDETAPAPEGDQPEQTVLSAEEANALFAEGGIEALVGRSFHPFTTEDGTQVDDGTTGVTASPIPALAPIKRTSRIAPLAGKVVATLKEGKKSVPEMAKMFEVAERDIRLAIDKARAQGEKIERLAPKVFGYPEKAPARRRLTANPSAATPAHQEPAH